MTIGPALKVEQRAEPADAGQDSRQFGFLGNGTDTTDELVAGFDAHAGFGVCQSLSRHLAAWKTLGKKSSIGRYNSAPLNEIHMVEPILEADVPPAPASRARILSVYSPNFG